MLEFIQYVLTNPWFLWIWGFLVLISSTYLFYDLSVRNVEIMSLMKWIWALTVLYSGPLGLAIYFYSGRKQIRRDSVWRKGFRSVAHCYSGCGMGEIAGVTLAAGLLVLGTTSVAVITFTMAYIAGFALTVGPLMQEGVEFNTAIKDAFYSETPSITIMEIVAIGTDIILAGEAGITEPLFWSALIFSLTMGLIAAYPVNVLLIKWGVKEGMMNPKNLAGP